MIAYGKPRSRRSMRQHIMSTMRGGKLMPVAGVPFRPGEAGMLHQEVVVEMEPIAGKLISDILLDIKCVYVPALACDEILNADPVAAGNTEIFRRRLLDGETIFPFEAESAITQRMGIEPIKIAGQQVTSSIARLAHNVAVNYLRRRVYWDAQQIPSFHQSVTPALLSSTVLDRFNAVLDPEDRINGAVSLEGTIPVKGIGTRVPVAGDRSAGLANAQTYLDSEGNEVLGQGWQVDRLAGDSDTNGRMNLVIEAGGEGNLRPNVRIEMDSAQPLSLKQFYMAEWQDKLIREIANFTMARPDDGPEAVARMLHGLNIDPGKQPFVVYENTVALGAGVRTGMDGPNLDVQITNTGARVAFSRMIPANEFGGFIVTFASIKPEEVIAGQPHPVLSEPWAVVNYAADDMVIDPDPVLRRQLDSDVAQANETDVMFWVGHNHFGRNYLQIDWSRDVDENTVDHRSSRWRYAIPLGVSPSNVIYPGDLDHYPFQLNAPTDPACSYAVKSVADIASPLKLGPTPVETLDFIDAENLLGDE